MPIDMSRPRVLVELNGADPVNIVTDRDIQVDVFDWDELRGVEPGDDLSTYNDNDWLIKIHDAWEQRSPNTARDIRTVLRERGVELPAEYNND
jgi:hypothetical protein